jgi:Ca2+-binding RTX toxin-like protein
VHFGPSPFAGVAGSFTALKRPAQARSGENVAALAYDAGADFSSSWIHFDKAQRRVGFYACRTGDGGDPPQPNVNVDAFDAGGNMIDNQQGIPCTLNGALVPVTVEKPGISWVNVAGTGGSAAPGNGWAIDDLEFEVDPPVVVPPVVVSPVALPPAPQVPPDAEDDESPLGACELAGVKPSRVGTAASDRLVGGTGRDTLSGKGGADCLAGRGGNDRLSGGSGGDRIYGESGGDRLTGGSGNDRLSGGSGDDRVSAGSGRDEVQGGPGSDTILARGGSRDTVRCGSGRDRVSADRADKIARDCERVSRR